MKTKTAEKSIGQEIKAVRKELGLNQTQLAEKLGVHRVTLAKWETGEVEPENPIMLRLALDSLTRDYISPEAAARLKERHKKLMADIKATHKRIEKTARELGVKVD